MVHNLVAQTTRRLGFTTPLLRIIKKLLKYILLAVIQNFSPLHLVITATENDDADMRSSGDYWLKSRLAGDLVGGCFRGASVFKKYLNTVYKPNVHPRPQGYNESPFLHRSQGHDFESRLSTRTFTYVRVHKFSQNLEAT
jgi:hypothetical protein